jgi:hypothetical protein
MQVLLAFVNVQCSLYPTLEVCNTHHDSKAAFAALPPSFSALLSDSCMEAKQGAAINMVATFASPYKTCIIHRFFLDYGQPVCLLILPKLKWQNHQQYP